MRSEPPIADALLVQEDAALWRPSWASWFTQVWQHLVYWTLYPVRTVTANYQALNTDSVILINGNITVTLPTAREGKNKRITCKAINAGGGTRTVDGNGSNIDGASTWTTTTQYTAQAFASDGVQWWKV